MNGSGTITRRGLIGGALLAGLGGKALAQGYAKAPMDFRKWYPAGHSPFPPITDRTRNSASNGGM
jgi:hypothetical protein